MTHGSDPAMPTGGEGGYPSGGLTKREYFAAMACMGLMFRTDSRIIPEPVAKAAIEFADTLIAELNKEPK